MVSFWVYDVAFLILFSLGIFWFLRRRRDELSREGLIFMWRTQFGVEAIGWFAKKFSGILNRIKYLVIGVGVVLMGAMVWMLGQTTSIYILHSKEIVEKMAAPPIAPLIPYFPKLFGMESYFPPFYFTYFIVALAIVAIVHEFSHGIFMRLFRVKIKSTGLVFLGPILGAFVEEEKSGFHKKGKLKQMTVLGAGVFANVLVALLFYLLYVLFFFSSFTSSGYIFDSYGMTAVPLENITGFEDVGNLTKVLTESENYYLDDNLAVQLTEVNGDYLIAYIEAPAILAEMKGAIVRANDVEILNVDSLREFMESQSPGDRVHFVTEDISTPHQIYEYDVVLGQHPEDSSRAYLGVGNNVANPRGFIQNFLVKFMSFKSSSTYYTPTWDGEFVDFILYLLWWVMVINLLVALFNMLPLGMLDGGRFFYLAVLGIFGSERIAKGAYKAATYLILFMFALMMFFWFVRII